jgi:hypothetical protein
MMRKPTLISIIPELAGILGQKATTLIERQRALVRARLLETLPGRGRGSGVVASPQSVAVLTTSLLASVALTDAASLTSEIASACPATRNRKCSLTGGATFLDAMVAILSDRQIVKRVGSIAVKDGHANIEFDNGKSRTGFVVLIEGVPKQTLQAQDNNWSRIHISISVDGDTLREIAALVAKLEANQ